MTKLKSPNNSQISFDDDIDWKPLPPPKMRARTETLPSLRRKDSDDDIY